MRLLESQQSTHDLSTEEGLTAYLTEPGSPFKSSSVSRLSGGFSAFTFRVQLEVPYKEPETGVLVNSLVVKHARAYASGSASVPLALERMDVEVAALELIPSLRETLQVDPKVKTARAIAYDQTNHLLFLTDHGSLPSVKDYFIAVEKSSGSTVIAEEIGKLLGEFIARLHVWGYERVHESNPPSVLEPFRKVEENKKVCAWRTAGRLPDIASQVSGDVFDWKALGAKLEKEVMETEETFNMGDYWTGNVLVKVSDDAQPTLTELVILDWELAKVGPAAADVGQFSGESLLLEQYASKNPALGRELLKSFLRTYGQTVATQSDLVPNGIEMKRALWNPSAIAVYTASHVGVWGKYVQWPYVPPEVKEKASKDAFSICVDSQREGFGEEDLMRLWG